MSEPNLPEQPFPEQPLAPLPNQDPNRDDSSLMPIADIAGEAVTGRLEIVGEAVSGGAEVVSGGLELVGEAASGCAGCSLVLVVLLVMASAALACAL